MKLLLHICCAPCAIHPFEELKAEGFDTITGFFYNPNIHPYTEYVNRRAAMEEYSRRHKFPVVFHKYDMENYFRAVAGNEETSVRCGICWRMRLSECGRYAADNGCDYFTTTLLVSPYQDHEKIRSIGKDVAAECGIKFLHRDFRPGFRSAQGKAKDERLYRQKYCGCVFSERHTSHTSNLVSFAVTGKTNQVRHINDSRHR